MFGIFILKSFWLPSFLLAGFVLLYHVRRLNKYLNCWSDLDLMSCGDLLSSEEYKRRKAMDGNLQIMPDNNELSLRFHVLTAVFLIMFLIGMICWLKL